MTYSEIVAAFRENILLQGYQPTAVRLHPVVHRAIIREAQDAFGLSPAWLNATELVGGLPLIVDPLHYGITVEWRPGFPFSSPQGA